MASKALEHDKSRPLRRSKRFSSGFIEPTPREPIRKNLKRGVEKRDPVAAVNGSGDVENASDDGAESPSKKSRVQIRGQVHNSGDEKEMDVQESVDDLEKTEDQEMDIDQDSSHHTYQPKAKICRDVLGDANLSPRVVLSEYFGPNHAVNEAKRVKPSTKGLITPTKSAMQIRSPATKHDVSSPKITSMDEYKRTMKAKLESSGVPPVNHHVPAGYPASEKLRQRVNYIPTPKETVQHKKQGVKETADKKRSSGHSSRGFLWYFWCLVLLVLLSASAVLLAHTVLQRTADGVEHSSRPVKLEKFVDHLSLLETQFPSQRSELWKRSKIHLEKHLKTAQPTEPVSLIFTAGLRAERTLYCLAQGLAASFSSALNASVLHINGASKTNQDSDKVKEDIDSQLRAAFEGDKPVAVVHRFEELPPGSTLIFYRYCDHENSAYKRVFLLFTVLLPQDEVRGELSLKDVEEMVQDHVKEKLVGSSNQNAFNQMDTDKYGGLWSRISHLVLPVVPEEEVEQKGCS